MCSPSGSVRQLASVLAPASTPTQLSAVVNPPRLLHAESSINTIGNHATFTTFVAGFIFADLSTYSTDMDLPYPYGPAYGACAPQRRHPARALLAPPLRARGSSAVSRRSSPPRFVQWCSRHSRRRSSWARQCSRSSRSSPSTRPTTVCRAGLSSRAPAALPSTP